MLSALVRASTVKLPVCWSWIGITASPSESVVAECCSTTLLPCWITSETGWFARGARVKGFCAWMRYDALLPLDSVSGPSSWSSYGDITRNRLVVMRRPFAEPSSILRLSRTQSAWVVTPAGTSNDADRFAVLPAGML